MTLDHFGELLVRLEALPAQLCFPVVKKATCPGLRFVVPQLIEGLSKDISRVQTLVGRQ